MNVYAVGASRHIGYYAAVRLLAKGAHVTFLLRSTSALENDETIRPYITSGHAKLVKGDALKAEDVAKGWAVAQADDRKVDLLLFTLGGLPHFSLRKGITLVPPNLVTQCLLNVFSTYPGSSTTPPPKLITLSTVGLTPRAHAAVPLLLKPVYGWVLAGPHADKLGSERLVVEASGRPWPAADPEPDAEIMPQGWKDAVAPKNGSAPWTDAVIVRPMLLTDGACKADEVAPGAALPYRYSEGELRGYTVSRRDVAHFITEVVLENWETWRGKAATVTY